MKRGLLWAGGGCVVTLATYAVAASKGGGMYLVTTGVIFFGLLQFLYGLFLYTIENFRAQQPVVEPVQPPPGDDWKSDPRWNALIKYDDDIAAAADELRPYGQMWVDKLGRDFFALEEDKQYLPKIVRKLIGEAKKEEGRRRVARFSQLNSGEACSEFSLETLLRAESEGYGLAVERDKTIAVTSKGGSISYLRSNYDIKRFGEYLICAVRRTD